MRHDLQPAWSWHRGEGGQTVWGVLELPLERRENLARRLASGLWRVVAHHGERAHPPILALCLAASLEGRG
eukprot:4874402-Pyramimonas_sp.AAC.1